MSLAPVARAVWEYAIALPFSVSKNEPRPFSDQWFRDNHGALLCGKDGRVGQRLRGWYWIATDLTNEQLLNAFAELPDAKRRPKGTERYRSIGDRVAESIQDIEPYICKTSFDGLRVVYNGHEGWARGRLGGHYMTANVSTGALRLAQHPRLHASGKWAARIFTEDMISSLKPNVQVEAKTLIASKLGRNVVELEWRAHYGWPVLCRG
jgi:hypothetical protein